jgi:hypothetical protein
VLIHYMEYEVYEQTKFKFIRQINK